jgi:hypothetical protein
VWIDNAINHSQWFSTKEFIMLEKLSTSKANQSITILIAATLALVLAFLGLANSGAFDRVPAISAAQLDAATYAPSRIALAESARWTMKAAESINLHGSTAWVIADPAAKIQQADVARLTAVTGMKVNLHGSTAVLKAGLNPAQRVEANRLIGVAAARYNPYGSTAIVSVGTVKGHQVDSDRLGSIAAAFFNPYGSSAWVDAGYAAKMGAESQRLTGLAGEYLNLYGTTLTQ